MSCNQSATGVFNISGGTFNGRVGNGGTFNISGGTFIATNMLTNSNTTYSITGGTFITESTYVGSLDASKVTSLNTEKYEIKIADTAQIYYKIDGSDSDAPYYARMTNDGKYNLAWINGSTLSYCPYSASSLSSYTISEVSDYSELKDIYKKATLPTLASGYQFVDNGNNTVTVVKD